MLYLNLSLMLATLATGWECDTACKQACRSGMGTRAVHFDMSAVDIQLRNISTLHLPLCLAMCWQFKRK